MKTEILEKTIFNQAVKITELENQLQESQEQSDRYRSWWQENEKTAAKFLQERDAAKKEAGELGEQIHAQIKKINGLEEVINRGKADNERLKNRVNQG